jgi:hypothetical protein
VVIWRLSDSLKRPWDLKESVERRAKESMNRNAIETIKKRRRVCASALYVCMYWERDTRFRVADVSFLSSTEILRKNKRLSKEIKGLRGEGVVLEMWLLKFQELVKENNFFEGDHVRKPFPFPKGRLSQFGASPYQLGKGMGPIETLVS